MKIIICGINPDYYELSKKDIGENLLIITKSKYTKFLNNSAFLLLDDFSVEYIFSTIMNMKINVEYFSSMTEMELNLAAKLNEKMGIRMFNTDFSNKFRNKYIMRNTAKNIVKQPSFELYKNQKNYVGDFVIKPLDGMATAGIETYLKGKIYKQEMIIEEKVISDKIVTSDGLFADGKIIALFSHEYGQSFLDNIEYGGKAHVTKTNMAYVEDLDKIKKLEKESSLLLEHFVDGNEVFPFHIEWFICNGEYILIEAAARLGGGIPQLIKKSFSYDIIQVYFDLLNLETKVFDYHIQIQRPKVLSETFQALTQDGKVTRNLRLYKNTFKFYQHYSIGDKTTRYCNMNDNIFVTSFYALSREELVQSENYYFNQIEKMYSKTILD